MDNYNKYLKDIYDSEIAFVRAEPTFIIKRIYFVSLKNGKSGFYIDNNNYLNDLYKSKFYNNVTYKTKIDNSFFLERSNNYISNVIMSINYYAHVKIIKDNQNPQLENQILTFKFGKRIFDLITEYTNNKLDNLSHTFKLKIMLTSGFRNFDKSYFTDTEIDLFDNNLNIESEISFPIFNMKAIQRKEKIAILNKIYK